MKQILPCLLGAAMTLSLGAPAPARGMDDIATTPDQPTCARDDWPAPTISLAFGSRYKDDSKSRSDIDPEGDAEVTAALKPIDDFIRIISAEANKALEGDAPEERADCIIGAMHEWAQVGALEDLQTLTARISVGSRIAGLAMAYIQIRDLGTHSHRLDEIDKWLRRMSITQIAFWADEAPPGAQEGNLRAWAGLGFAATGLATDDQELLEVAATTINNLICTANDDGSLPQEMRRGKYALHYQLHATAPLVVASALLQQVEIAADLPCMERLPEVVAFGLNDLLDGTASQSYSGKEQSYFDGTETTEPHEFAWLIAYMNLALADNNPPLLDHVPPGPWKNSKLGGDQLLLWQHGTFAGSLPATSD